MSDIRLQTLQRTWEESGENDDLLAYLLEIQRTEGEDLACPGCHRSAAAFSSVQSFSTWGVTVETTTCFFCGTVYSPSARKRKIASLQPLLPTVLSTITMMNTMAGGFSMLEAGEGTIIGSMFQADSLAHINIISNPMIPQDQMLIVNPDTLEGIARVLPPPESMNGFADQFGGSDYP